MLSRHRYIGPQALIWSWIYSATSSSAWLEQALLHMGYIYTWKGYDPSRHSQRGHSEHVRSMEPSPTPHAWAFNFCCFAAHFRPLSHTPRPVNCQIQHPCRRSPSGCGVFRPKVQGLL